MDGAARRIELSYEITGANDLWVLEEEDVPESALHDVIIFLLTEILLAWRAREGRDARVGRNIALRWNAASPRQGVDPDVYVVEPAPPEGDALTSLCTWKRGHSAPRVAVEVVSESTAHKDYSDGPDRYGASGTQELWIFDPLLLGDGDRGGPFALQVWRRDRGCFRRVYAGDGPARSEELGAWLVVTDDGKRLRLADDPAGTKLWPTPEEAESAARRRAEEEVARLRAELDAARAPKRTTRKR